MTTLIDHVDAGLPQDIPAPNGTRISAWVRAHQTSLKVATPLLLMIALIHAWNMGGWPGPVNGDEGTYVAQAWSIVTNGQLTPHTYNYDHPPLGWIVISLYAWATGGFSPDSSSLMVGREMMLIANVVSCGLLYILARRLGMHRAFAAATMVVFALNPISLQYHRMVFLDNLEVVWVLAALVFAASPRRSLSAAMGSGLCLAGAILTKETAALFFPFVVWLLIQNSDKRTRIWNIVVLTTITATTAFFTYVMYAIVKGELFSGPGHVSLLGMFAWQLWGRQGSGSILDPASDTHALVNTWIDADPWLLIGGAILIPAGLWIYRLRPITAALLVQVLIMFRGGYVPYPFVIALLPCAALVICGVADTWWRAKSVGLRTLGRAVVAAGVIAFAFTGAQAWGQTLQTSVTADLSGPHRQATDWIIAHVPKDAVIIVDDYMWTDLKEAGFRNNILVYKTDLDPEVHAKFLPNGYASVDYVATGRPTINAATGLETVTAAIEHSTVVATFGADETVIRKVTKPPT